MDLEQVIGVVERLARVDIADEGAVRAGLGDVRRLRAWVDGREVALARVLTETAMIPEVAVAYAGGVSEKAAARVVERVSVAGAVPVFERALASGDVSGGHLDALGRGLRQLEPGRRDELLDRATSLVEVARASTVEEFERSVRAEVRRIEADGGEALLARQQRATRLKTWVDTEGMWCIHGRFDPETGLRLHAGLRAAVDALFADKAPEGCPTDPGEKQDFLRGRALVGLLDGTVTSGGRAEIVPVIDTTETSPTGGPVVDWGLPVEVPWRVLVDLAGRAEISPVIVRNGVVLHAPGCLDLGRTTRLANRAQRRALRALYPTCAIPGCAVRYEFCKLHHVIWWDHGGPTDLANLLPVCERHHHAIHDLGWLLTLQLDRTLTITHPNGAIQTTGPPRRRAAA